MMSAVLSIGSSKFELPILELQISSSLKFNILLFILSNAENFMLEKVSTFIKQAYWFYTKQKCQKIWRDNTKFF